MILLLKNLVNTQDCNGKAELCENEKGIETA